MEVAASNFLSSSLSLPPRTQLKTFSPPASALKNYEPATPALTSMLASSLAQYFPTSVLLQEQRCESKPLLQTIKDDPTSQAMVDRGPIETDQYLKEFQGQLLHWPGLSYLLPSSHTGEKPALSLTKGPFSNRTKKHTDIEPEEVLALARRALSASKEAASLAEYGEPEEVLDESTFFSLGSTSSNEIQMENVKFVKSTRLLERQSKRKRGPKLSGIVHETSASRKADSERKTTNRNFDSNDPLRLFLASPVTRQLLTSKQERDLIVQIKALMKLDEVKSRLQAQFGREPTLVEWAEAVDLSCHTLQSQIHRGNSSRERLIYANFRMVVHIAKQYQGRGLSLQDLMQEGSMGLMRSVQKFEPQVGCRFATYAYWWIRQSVRRAIFQHSRTIRLPDSVYTLLSKVKEAKRVCIQEGHHCPTKEQIAAKAGMTVEKLQKLLFSARMPLSIQQPVWSDQDTTFQEVTADNAIESPEISVSKQFMRNHISNLLRILSPKERKIIRLRFGIGGGKPKSLAEIGLVFGLSKERVRQLESRSLYKLKQCFESQGLGAYTKLLV